MFETKKCKKCSEIKFLNEFSNNSKSKDRKSYSCRECEKDQNKKYYLENVEISNNRSKTYYEKNKDKNLVYKKEYYQENKENILYKNVLYNRKRRKEDPLYRLKKNISNNIANTLKSKELRKTKRTIEILGCSVSEFKLYIETQFEDWMDWSNYGLYNGELNYGWDLDHKQPSSSAQTEEELLALNHYSNFQPLCSKINRDIKHSRLDYIPHQIKL